MSASRSVPRPAPEYSSTVITRPSAPSRTRTPTHHRPLRRAAQRGHPARSRRGTPREPLDRPEAEHEESMYINSPLTFGGDPDGYCRLSAERGSDSPHPWSAYGVARLSLIHISE